MRLGMFLTFVASLMISAVSYGADAGPSSPAATVDATATTTATTTPFDAKVGDLLKEKNKTDLPEDQQPAFKHDVPSVKMSSPNGVLLRLMIGLLVVLGIGFGTLFYFKKSAGFHKSKRGALMIQMISQMRVGPKSSIAVVQVAGESMLVGITEQNIQLIKSLAILDEDVSQAFDEDEGDEEDVFSIRGIKDVVNQRLKNLKV